MLSHSAVRKLSSCNTVSAVMSIAGALSCHVGGPGCPHMECADIAVFAYFRLPPRYVRASLKTSRSIQTLDPPTMFFVRFLVRYVCEWILNLNMHVHPDVSHRHAFMLPQKSCALSEARATLVPDMHKLGIAYDRSKLPWSSRKQPLPQPHASTFPACNALFSPEVYSVVCTAFISLGSSLGEVTPGPRSSLTSRPCTQESTQLSCPLPHRY